MNLVRTEPDALKLLVSTYTCYKMGSIGKVYQTSCCVHILLGNSSTL